MLIEDLIFRYANRIFHKFIVEGKMVFFQSLEMQTSMRVMVCMIMILIFQKRCPKSLKFVILERLSWLNLEAIQLPKCSII